MSFLMLSPLLIRPCPLASLEDWDGASGKLGLSPVKGGESVVECGMAIIETGCCSV